MTLAQIAVLIYRLLTGQMDLYGLVKAIWDEGQSNAKEQNAFDIWNETVAIYSDLNNATYGLVPIVNKLDAILTAIDQVNNTVVLPSTPPAGYGGAEAADVWNYQLPIFNQYTGTLLSYAGTAALSLGRQMLVPQRNTPWFGVRGQFWDADNPLPSFDLPCGDWSDVEPDDTRLSWLTRTEPNWDWDEDQVSHAITGDSILQPTLASHPVFLMSEEQFRREVRLRTAGDTAPVWPGLDAVTLGTPVVCTSSQLVSGPMDGILVSIDSVDPGTGVQTIGSFNNYKWAGWLAFVTDNSDVEEQQYLNYDTAVYCPKRTTQAASVLVWLTRASQITVTPWTLLA